MSEPRVTCRTPNPGRSGTTAIPTWKFETVRDVIHAVLTRGAIRFSELTEAVRTQIKKADLEQLGSLGWHVTTVKLELEVRGEIERVACPGPQQIRLVE